MALELPAVPEWRNVLKARIHYAKTQTLKLKSPSIAGITMKQALSLEEMLVYRQDLEMLMFLREMADYWIELLTMKNTDFWPSGVSWSETRSQHTRCLGWVLAMDCSDLTRFEQVLEFLHVGYREFSLALITSAIVHNQVPLLEFMSKKYAEPTRCLALYPGAWYKPCCHLEGNMIPFEPRSIWASHEAFLWCCSFGKVEWSLFDTCPYATTPLCTFMNRCLQELRDELLLAGKHEVDIVSIINSLTGDTSWTWEEISQWE